MVFCLSFSPFYNGNEPDLIRNCHDSVIEESVSCFCIRKRVSIFFKAWSLNLVRSVDESRPLALGPKNCTTFEHEANNRLSITHQMIKDWNEILHYTALKFEEAKNLMTQFSHRRTWVQTRARTHTHSPSRPFKHWFHI